MIASRAGILMLAQFKANVAERKSYTGPRMEASSRKLARIFHDRNRSRGPGGRLAFLVPVALAPVPPAPPPKVSRNEPGPCGSGKKFKHCCG
jgi:uncharacterized protein YecA (UPF0149 family)